MPEVVCLEDEDSIDNELTDTSDNEYSEVDPAEEESREDSDVDLPSPDDASGQDRASGSNLEPVANVDQALEEEKRELLEEYEEKGDLLTRFQELLMKNAEMEEKVNKADKRLMSLRTQLEETTEARELLEAECEEFNTHRRGR